MNIARRMIALWLLGSVAWIGFWLWTYSTKCMRMGNGTLWCPIGDADTLARTDYGRMALTVLGPPFWALAVGSLCWWALEGFRRRWRAK